MSRLVHPARSATSTATPRAGRSWHPGGTLLFIHGTFSRATGAFSELPLDSMQALQAIYDDRVIAFDHQSISRDPTENIAWLLGTIPDGLTLDLDIVCHSRGGLVARSLSERTDPMPGTRKIKVHRTALVGAVNDGTILADVSIGTTSSTRCRRS